jgi:Amt family ammonium transporter
MYTAWGWKRAWGKPDPGMTANGMLAGLVAITAPSGFVAPWAAFVIGAIAGVVVVVAYRIVDTRLKIDDPVGAFSVHGVNGLWGVIALGLFADGTYGAGWNGIDGTVTGLFYGDGGQLLAQLAGVLTLIVWAGGGTYLFMKAQDRIMGIRVPAEEEIAGLDVPQLGAPGYHDVVPQHALVELPEAAEPAYAGDGGVPA